MTPLALTAASVQASAPDLYHMPDPPWELRAIVFSAVVGLAVAAVFIRLIITRPGRRLLLTALGLAAIAAIVGGFVVHLGPAVTWDAQGRQWYCPSGIDAVQISESHGQPLPAAVADCRRIAYRNVTIGSLLTAVGIALAVFATRLQPKRAVPAREDPGSVRLTQSPVEPSRCSRMRSAWPR